MRFDLRRPEDLGKAIVEFRTLRGLTQAELAEHAELHRTYLSNLERGEVPEYVRRYFTLLAELDLQITVTAR